MISIFLTFHTAAISPHGTETVSYTHLGSTNLLSGAIVDLHEFRAANRAIAERVAAGETDLVPATAEHVLMGITKA